MTAISVKSCLLVGIACALPRAASAQEIDEPVHINLPPPSGIGMQLMLGGGVTQFTDRTLRDTTSPVGGLWDLRGSIGTRVPLGLEVAYIGSAAQIRSLFGPSTATMIGTTLETDLRLNLMPHYVIDPYAFAGFGWTRYSIDEETFTLAATGIANHDDLMEVPLGAGISYRWAGIVADMRGTFRATQGSNLVLAESSTRTTMTGSFAPMHSWDATLALGYEF
jgi:hypothetical protein